MQPGKQYFHEKTLFLNNNIISIPVQEVYQLQLDQKRNNDLISILQSVNYAYDYFAYAHAYDSIKPHDKRRAIYKSKENATFDSDDLYR